MDILREFTNRLSARVESIEAECAQRGIPFETLTVSDCYAKGNTDLESCVVVIKPEKLSGEYRTIDQQLDYLI